MRCSRGDGICGSRATTHVRPQISKLGAGIEVITSLVKSTVLADGRGFKTHTRISNLGQESADLHDPTTPNL